MNPAPKGDDEPAVEPIEAFCRRIGPRLVGTLRLQCGSRPVAEELAQEALARAWERWDRVSAMASPEAWTYRVALNLAASHRRRKAAERRALGRHGVRSDQSDEDPAGGLAVRQAVAALPARQRAAVVLRYFAGLSTRETAEVLGCAEGTVRSLTSQGIAALRTAIQDRHPVEELR